MHNSEYTDAETLKEDKIVVDESKTFIGEDEDTLLIVSSNYEGTHDTPSVYLKVPVNRYGSNESFGTDDPNQVKRIIIHMAKMAKLSVSFEEDPNAEPPKTIDGLMGWAWLNNEKSGFHKGRPKDDSSMLGHWQGNKLMMITGEIVEAHEELRKGIPVTETYYEDVTVPHSLSSEVGYDKAKELMEERAADAPRKPEGVPSELADAVIRIMDFCASEGIDLESAIVEKLSYNESRPYMHNKKF